MKKSCCNTVYYYDLSSPGVRELIWSEDDAVPQNDLKNIFTGPPNPDTFGTPSHPNTPTIDVTTASWANANTANDPSNGTDQAVWAGYFYADQDGTVIGDASPQNGERFRVWLGDCCSAPKVIYESPEGDDSPFVGGVANGIGPFYTVDKGWHLLIVEVSDRAAYSGFYLTFNGDRYEGPSQLSKPQLLCKKVDCNYELQEFEYDCVPSDCQPKAILPGGGDTLTAAAITALIGEHAEPCTVAGDLISDNDQSDGNWSRAAEVGTETKYARCDHKHPIVRLPMEPDPVLTMGGTFVQLASLITDRGSNEEEIWYRFRVQVSQVAGNNWGFITVPTIAGYQQPVYSEIGGYQVSSIAVQDDDGSFGATPRGPLMGYPMLHWSSTNRLYGGIFRRDNSINSLFVNFVVKYTRN